MKEKPAGELIESQNEGSGRQPTARVSIRLPLNILQFIDELRNSKKGSIPSRSEVVRNIIIAHALMHETSAKIPIAGKDGTDFVKLSDVVNALTSYFKTESNVKVGRPKKDTTASEPKEPEKPHPQ